MKYIFYQIVCILSIPVCIALAAKSPHEFITVIFCLIAGALFVLFFVFMDANMCGGDDD